MKKVRLVYHANHIRYKDVKVKDDEEAEELLCYIDNTWNDGKSYDQSYVEDIPTKEKINDNRR